MDKIKRLNPYQKCILIVMAAMALFFAVMYSMTIQRVQGYHSCAEAGKWQYRVFRQNKRAVGAVYRIRG